MPPWKKHLYRFGGRLDDRLDALKLRLRKRTGAFRRLQLLPYRGFGNSEKIHLKGRVLKERGSGETIEKGRLWHNVLATYRRFHTVEIPHAQLRASSGGLSVEGITDKEGYFDLELNTGTGAAIAPWREIRYELLSPAPANQPVVASGWALVPPSSAEFGVISDIDDTIIVSRASSLLRLAYNTFLRNARSRVAFAGVAAFYRALEDELHRFNPIFYVSSGPWNLYDLLIDFMELNHIPAGPILLQDYGIDETKFLIASHLDHKMAQIRTLLQTYPDLPFILVGDSGQHDPEIYRNVLAEVPARIKAIYIRDVTGTARGTVIRGLAEEARQHGGELLLVKDSLEAAGHAAERGFISPHYLPEIAGEKREDESGPPATSRNDSLADAELAED